MTSIFLRYPRGPVADGADVEVRGESRRERWAIVLEHLSASSMPTHLDRGSNLLKVLLGVGVRPTRKLLTEYVGRN